MYVVARNASGRPTLQHLLLPGTNATACGWSVLEWSRAYQAKPIEAILCRQPGCRSGKG